MALLDNNNKFIDLLKIYNENVNIYSKNSYDKLSFHIQDSLNISMIISNISCNVVDIGSGSGFPAVFIAMKNTNNRVYAVESKKKKCDFLSLAKTKLSLENLFIINSDINEFLRNNTYDIRFFTAKAFGDYTKVKKILSKAKLRDSNLIIPVSKSQYSELKRELQGAFQIITIDQAEFFYLCLKAPFARK